MKKSLFLMAIFLCITSIGFASDYDVTADLIHTSSSWNSPNPISSASGGHVLWDLTYGVYLDYEPSGRYSILISLLHSLGFSIQTTTAGLENVDLSNYDIIVICLGSSWYGTYSAAQVEAIKIFVENGGGLLIIGENTSGPNLNINPVANAFGVTCGISFLWPFDLYITDLSTHPIFDNVTQIYYRMAGEISADPPSEYVATYDGFGVAAIAEVESGKVVVLGDVNCWDNVYIGNAGNQLFAENTFKWLATRRPQEVSVDIKPQSCPNPLNLKSKGVLPLAILGAEDLDVMSIDPSTVRISRAGSEMGVAPIRWSSEDVSTPFEGDSCECHEQGGDGYLDLTLKFNSQELVEQLDLHQYAGESVSLFITGNLKEEYGSTPIEGQDCIKILKNEIKRK